MDNRTHNGRQEQTLAIQETRVERKNLRVAVKENHRGKFLKVTEECSGKASSVIVPYDGIEEFVAMINKVAADGA